MPSDSPSSTRLAMKIIMTWLASAPSAVLRLPGGTRCGQAECAVILVDDGVTGMAL